MSYNLCSLYISFYVIIDSFCVQGNGSNSSANSFLLMAHMDVVPVEEENWDEPPFSGSWHGRDEAEGGYVHGRGAIDDKLSVVVRG